MSVLIRVAVLVGCCGLLFGYSTASIADWLAPIADEFSLPTAGQEYLTSSLVIACFFGAIAAGPLSGRLGRKGALATAFVLALVGYGITLGHPGLSGLIAARVIIGLSVGISSTVAPMFAGEATPVKHRGAVVALFQLAVTFGILAAYAVPLLAHGRITWPEAIGGGGLIPILGLLMLSTVPESPAWLVARGRTAQAADAARRLQMPVPERAQGHETTTGWAARLRIGTTLPVLLLCCGFFVLQNFSGIDGILYYAATIFSELGFPPGLATLGATFGLGLVNVLATIVAILTIDRIGRRSLAIFGSAAMILGLSATVASHLWTLPMLGLVGLCLYIAAFAISLGPLPYVLIAELAPSYFREPGLSAGSATSWLFNAMIAFFFLSAVQAVTLSGVFLFFTLICCVSLVVSLIYLPETKGVSLDDIERDILAGVRLRDVGRAGSDADKA